MAVSVRPRDTFITHGPTHRGSRTHSSVDATSDALSRSNESPDNKEASVSGTSTRHHVTIYPREHRFRARFGTTPRSVVKLNLRTAIHDNTQVMKSDTISHKCNCFMGDDAIAVCPRNPERSGVDST